MKKIIFGSFLIFLFSCRKDKAESPAPFLIGEWEYYFSYNTTTGGSIVDPNSEYYFFIKIDNDGKAYVYDKDGLVEKGHIKNIELVAEYQSPEVSYFYRISFHRTSCFKEKYILNGIDRIWYWPSYNYGPGGTKEQIRIFTNKWNGNVIDRLEMYYKRKP